MNMVVLGEMKYRGSLSTNLKKRIFYDYRRVPKWISWTVRDSG